MVLKVCAKETRTTFCIANGAVEEKLSVEEVGCRRSGVIRIGEAVATSDTADPPFFCFQWSVITNERSVSNITTFGNILAPDKFNSIRAFNAVFVSLRKTAEFIAKGMIPSDFFRASAERSYRLFLAVFAVDMVNCRV